ncbi:MAG: Fic family protein [Ignavibacteriaceae bacterium]|nr:Fic family protein [Ignavibacteriaceae bacterium]
MKNYKDNSSSNSDNYRSDVNIFYTVKPDIALEKLLELTEELNEEIKRLKPVEGDLWQTIEEKLLIEWTYNSNAIEGSSLTQGETLFFLQSGLTVEGRPLKDFIDAKNHAEAIDFLYDVVNNRREISTGLLKEFNAFLLSGIKSTPAIDSNGIKIDKKATPGEYKLLPNHVLQNDGTIHEFVLPTQVAPEMANLCNWIKENGNNTHPVIVGSIAHFNMVRIHPFDDGNGRGARLLMNLILIQKGYPPAIIKNENRRKYIESLSQADKGNLNKFIEFIAESCIDTQKSVLENLR